MPNLVGIGLSQVPTNSMLGGLAYQSPDHASIKDLDLKNLSQINSEIADTAVDIFIYDTSKDSDGGAWRKRTQHTSWYNETLNTATRGSRREFPAVAVIVAESNQVTIYDGDDPDLPMWMVFNTTDGSMLRSAAITATSMLNGELCVCHTSGSGFHRIWFLKDTARWLTSSTGYGGYYGFASNSGGTTIAERNTAGGNYLNNISGASDIVIVSSNCNDVAMTVLPNAPIDSATGLSIPTIAVATQQGISVITDSGTIYDLTPESNAGYASIKDFMQVAFTKDNHIVFTDRQTASGYSNIIYLPFYEYDQDLTDQYSSLPNSYNYVWNEEIRSGGATIGYWKRTNTDEEWDYLTTTSDSFVVANGDNANGIRGITRIGTIPNQLMVNRITTDYNTGWMYGYNEGTFLADTDATNVTGTELIPNPGNGNFTATTDWQATSSGGTLSISNSNLKVVCTGNYQGCKVNVSNLPTLVEGKQYIMTVDVAAVSGGSIRFGVVSGSVYNGTIGGNGIFSMVLTAGASITEIFVDNGTSGSMYFELNSVNLRLAELDRSAKGGVNYPAKGLGVYGTITKSAVATGAELVAYSGFNGNNSNYLEQPYNSDLDFGTGDCSMMYWFYQSTNSNYQDVLSRQLSSTANGGWTFQHQNNGTIRFYVRSSGGYNTVLTSDNSITTSSWTHVAVVRTGNNFNMYINGVIGDASGGTETGTMTLSNANLRISTRLDQTAYPILTGNSIALVRLSASAPSAEQIKKIYEDEKVLFQENAKCTLYGSSGVVTALACDEVTDRLYVGTSSGRSDFQGLRRINNTTTAVTTAISAHDEFIVEQ